MSTETELKLIFDPKDQARLIDALQASDIELMPAVHLNAQYFDTPDGLLRANGYGLRVRREHEQWVQSIKSTGTAVGAMYVRKELNQVIEGPDLDLTKLPIKGKLGKLFESPKVRKRLQPVVQTQIQRQIGRWSDDDDTVIEVAVDIGEVLAGKAKSPVHELEIELLRGKPARLHALAKKLADQVPLQLQVVNKAEQGFALIKPQMAPPVFADLPGLYRDMTAEDGFAHILECCLAHFHGNYQAVVDGDVEGVHQMRVGLRRMRACIHVYKKLIPVELTDTHRQDIRWLNEALGPVRDWDVFLADFGLVLVQFPERKNLSRVVTLGNSLRTMHHAQLRERLQSERYHQWVLRLADWVYNRRWNEDLRRKQRMKILKPLDEFAQEILNSGQERLQHDGEGFADLPLESKHALRIRVKHLRYALQFFSALYPDKSTQKMLNALALLQDELGQLNDLRTTTDRLNEMGLSSNHPGRCLLEGWYKARQLEQLNQSTASWRVFNQLSLPWTKG